MTEPVAQPVRLGVFGGAFDPPHRAHRALAEAALAQLRLDRLHIVPTGQAWHKARSLSPPADRLAMARLAFAGLPQVVVDPVETLREGPSYTIDTLRSLQAANPLADLFLVIGQDQAQALPSWRCWEEIVQTAIICVAARPDSAGAAGRWVPPAGLAARFLQLQFPELPFSATDIRRRAAAGQDVAPMVGDAVARYIADHHLYRPA